MIHKIPDPFQKKANYVKTKSAYFIIEELHSLRLNCMVGEMSIEAALTDNASLRMQVILNYSLTPVSRGKFF